MYQKGFAMSLISYGALGLGIIAMSIAGFLLISWDRMRRDVPFEGFFGNRFVMIRFRTGGDVQKHVVADPRHPETNSYR